MLTHHPSTLNRTPAHIENFGGISLGVRCANWRIYLTLPMLKVREKRRKHGSLIFRKVPAMPLMLDNPLLDVIAAFQARNRLGLVRKTVPVANFLWCRARNYTSPPTPNRTCRFPSIRLSKLFLVIRLLRF